MGAPELGGARPGSNWRINGPKFLLESERYRAGTIDPNTMSPVVGPIESALNGSHDIAEDLTQLGLWGYKVYPSDKYDGSNLMEEDERVIELVRGALLLGAAIGKRMSDADVEFPDSVTSLAEQVRLTDVDRPAFSVRAPWRQTITVKET